VKPEEPALDAAESAARGLTRRRFFRWASAIGATLSAALIGLPSLRAFLTPAFQRPSKKDWIKVAESDLIEIGTPVKVDFVEAMNDAWVEERALRTVWLYTEDGESFLAWNGTCTHLACSYGFDADKKVFHCPCHHGLFDVKTGKVLDGPPPRPLDSLEVRIVEGELQVLYKNFRAGIPQKVEV
jgi:menaquinol-cytochrome c reductase iron-sulfur subunit